MDFFGSNTSKAIDGLKEAVEKDFNELGKTLENIRGDVKGVSGKLDKLDSNVKQEVESIKFVISNGNDTLIDSFKEIKSDLSKLIKRQDEELEDLRDKANRVEELRKTLTEKNNLIDELNDKLKRAEDEAGNLSRELQDMDAKLTAAQDELRIERQNHDATKMALQSWRDAVADYAQVRDAMQNCSTFENLLKDRGLTDETEKGLFAFVQELGKTIDFLSSVYQAAYDARKVQPTLMTKEECAVYMALNRCYRKIWNIDFDVFVTPGNRPISDDIEKIPFSRDDSIALKDPRNRSFRYVTGIYVPLLLGREGNKVKPAYVEAVNF